MEIKKITLALMLATAAFSSCKKDNAVESETSLRTKIDYAKITADTKYDNTNTLFVDASGKSTVDLTNGNNRYKMFQAINAYAGTGTTVALDANVLKAMFSNTGTPFTGTYASLNGTTVQLRNVVATTFSATDKAAILAKFDADFTNMATASSSFAATASNGVAGKLGTRLVDAKGLEVAQIIQKGLIGALQIDYISNVLLNTGLSADNKTVVSGKNYTQLEQNWDEAYGLLTINPNYLAGSTDAARGTTEFALGSYIWEYGQPASNANYNYTKILGAFLKGRAAIANNDLTEVKAQALIIRTTIEQSIARAAVGYLTKYGTRTTDADRAHDIGEGGGFIYSLRFLKMSGGDAAFSDGVLTGLLGANGNFWEITPAKIATATAAIKAKFNI
ncbi:DUF4856 domain-containing protein [Pedobacter aquatilis]|uniref:DUF4856 domain-containing protein n=1 Tax=Pedobacter aquatilis TaxID=351343 RepID=UPI00292F7F2D|nr:DUF4856 domain-containing protein [Pedobacter aquatilis]